ncbi:hypothetical protein AB0940_24865 [Streptomyces sp. NPDC006656]|uniref:hypothetical protein n=1 Tax=Streptomyces sp. NPDC006656 TaxID=3156899 RepID=UPI003456F704
MTYRSGVRLLLVGAVAVLLLACTVAAWALPHTPVTSPSAGVSASQADAGCARGTGLGPEPCVSEPVSPVAASQPTVPTVPGVAGLPGLDARSALLLFSTIAVAAAIALVSAAGRRL